MSKDPFRIVRINFWDDEKVVEMFTPEDKYFYLYLLTNKHTTQLGIYKFIPKIAAFELGYSKDTVMGLLSRFEYQYGVIKYSSETNEIAIKNFLRHSIVTGGQPVLDLMKSELGKVEDRDLVYYIYNNLVKYNNLNTTVKDLLKYINELMINENDSSTNRGTTRVINFPEGENENQKIDDFFETCWKAYPRKLGKGDVKDGTKRRLYREVGLEQMLRCIERYKQANVGTEEKYLRYGGTFFNSGYIDYLDENYEAENDVPQHTGRSKRCRQ